MSPTTDSPKDQTRARTIDEEMADRYLAFAEIVTHDVKSPLANVSGYAQLIQRLLAKPEKLNIQTESANRIAAAASKIVDNARRVQERVDLLQEALVLGAGHVQVQREPIGLGELLTQIIAEHQAMETQRSLHLIQTTPSIVVEGDTKLLRRLLENLIGNALRFSPEGAVVTIESRSHHNEAIITITDQGIGITPDELPLLFRPFLRLPRTRAAGGGAGLGLYVARGIARLHSGDIRAISEGAGRGATFQVTLPIRPSAASSA